MFKINILGVYLHQINKKEVRKKIERSVQEAKPRYVVTPNPEILLQAGQDEELFYILNRADISLPDGIGLKIAGWFMGKNLRRLPGADLTRDILELARDKQWRVGIVNYKEGLSSNQEIEKTLKKKFSGLRVEVSSVPRQERKIKNFKDPKLQQFSPHIILVGLGSPWQEKLLFHSLKNFPGVGLGVGVGGSLDFLTGKTVRAPKPLRLIGMEWLWRLGKQPSRIGRIYRATVVFPLEFFKWRFILPWKYRSNVACLLYKKENGQYKILVVERKEGEGQWQLPQGGTEGEDVVTAGSRELKEELNCANFRPRTFYKDLHKYKFPEKGEMRGRGHNYKGQKQSLLIAEFTGKDSDIGVNFWEHQNWQWVDKDNLLATVQPIRRKATKKFLTKFEQFINK